MRPVWQLTLNGERVKQYTSVVDAIAATNTPPRSLSAALRGTVKQANGFKWSYVEKELCEKEKALVKICKTCKVEKQLHGNFCKAVKSLDGYAANCKQCYHAHVKVLDATAEARKEHDDNKERCCKKCNEWKPFSGFHNSTKGRHGLMSRCKVCVRQYNRKWAKDKKTTDAEFRLLCNLRRRMTIAIQKVKQRVANSNKCDSTLKLLGTDIGTLKQHIEQKFQEGMTWDNYGEWHMDHIRPCASYDMSIDENQRQCFHYSNLQPLWAADNLRKGAKYTVPIE